MKTTLSLIAVAIICSGCVGGQTAALVRALSKDPATVSAKIVTPWGTASLVRVGGTTNNVVVSQDGTVTLGKQ